jgi:hypothetical protein
LCDERAVSLSDFGRMHHPHRGKVTV